MASKEKKRMTFETALDLLKGDVLNCPQADLDEAMLIVQEKDPENHILKAAQNKIGTYLNENNLRENNPQVYLYNISNMENVLRNYNYQDFINQNKDIKNYVSSIDLFEKENDTAKKLDPKRKQEYMALLYEAAVLKAQASLAGNAEFTKKSVAEQEELIKEEIKNVFFADFARVAISPYIKSPTKKEEKLGTKENRQYIVKQVQNAANAFKNIITGKKHISVETDYVLASYADSTSQIETYIKTIKEKAKKAEKSVRDRFNKVAQFFQEKKNKIEKTANFISNNKYEIWKNIKGSFKDNKIKLIGNISAATAFGIVTAGIAAGTIGAPLTAAVGAYAAYHAAGSWVYPIIAEMRKINRQRREKGIAPLKFKDQLKQAWKNKTSKDEQKNSYKARNTYIVNGVVNTGLAAVGFGFLKNGLEAIDNAKMITDGIQEGVEATQNVSAINIDIANSIAETKHAVSMGRIAIPLAGQLSDAAVTYAISAADPDNKEKAEEAKQTAVAALVGVGFSALAQGFSYGIQSVVDTNEASEIAQTTAQDMDITPAATSAQETLVAQETVTTTSFFGKVKNLFTFGSKEPVEYSIDNYPEQPDSIVEADGYMAANSSDADTSGISSFPDTYNSEMGITKAEYNILVKTTEGTLKSATGEEITLDRAYMNLTDETMAHFPNQTREEVLYKFNRLYAFMRKAYQVDSNILRETPSGIQYLEERFTNMNLTLDESKMNTLVSFAQSNTYADSSEIREGLKDILPEGTSEKVTSAIVTTIHSNQRFYQHAEEMESLIKLLGCGEQINAQQAVKINALFEQTDQILSTGKANTVFTGLNLSKGCLDDDGEWRRVVVSNDEPPAVVTPKEEPVIVVEPKEKPIEPVVPTVKSTPTPQPSVVPDTMPEPKVVPEPVANPQQVTEEIIVTKSVSSNVHGISNSEFADKSKIIEGTAASHWEERANDSGIETVIVKQTNSTDSIPPVAPVSENPVTTGDNDSIVVTKSSSSNLHGLSSAEHADQSKVIQGAREKQWIKRSSR